MVTRVGSARRAYIALGVVLASVASVALAATFNLFSPAAGILKGNPSTYVTTAATSTDVVATFSGTCNSSAVLKGDGSCAPASTGTVTSVGLTTPTGLTVTGSPVTTSGTLAVSTTLSGVVHGNGSGFTAGNVALGSEVSGTLPVGNGGTGAATLSGLLKGNGTSAFTSAVASDVYGLWAGGCSSSNFLRGDGTCASPGGGGTVTSIAAGTGLSASPGSPITSSGTLSLNLANANTWSAMQSFSGGGDLLHLIESASNGFISFYNSANTTRRGYIESSATNNRINIYTEGTNDLYLGTNAAARVQISGSTGVVAVNGANSLTVNGQNVCLANGTNCPSPGLAATNFASAFCFAAGGLGSSPSNVSACTRNNTGDYTITLSPGISNARCHASRDVNSFPASAAVPMVHTNSFTSVSVRWMTTAAAAIDTDFLIMCQF